MLFKRYGFDFSLHSLRNMLPLTKGMHGKGRHLDRYHQRAFAFIRDKLAAAGKYGDQAYKEFRNAMDDLAEEILKDPNKRFGP